MEFLNLSRNRLYDHGTHQLAACIDKIDILWLENCNISDEGVSALANQIKKRNQPVKVSIDFVLKW